MSKSQAPISLVPVVQSGSGQSSHEQMQECVLYGSVQEDSVENLRLRLKGIADPQTAEFEEHVTVFSLSETYLFVAGAGGTPVTVRASSPKTPDLKMLNSWHICYLGVPEPDPTNSCPTIVRKRIDAMLSCSNSDCMNLFRTMGLRLDYDYSAKGHVYTKGRLKITLTSIRRLPEPGHYSNFEEIGKHRLVELSLMLPAGGDFTAAAKQVRDFADQLKPVVNMTKVAV